MSIIQYDDAQGKPGHRLMTSSPTEMRGIGSTPLSFHCPNPMTTHIITISRLTTAYDPHHAPRQPTRPEDRAPSGGPRGLAGHYLAGRPRRDRRQRPDVLVVDALVTIAARGRLTLAVVWGGYQVQGAYLERHGHLITAAMWVALRTAAWMVF